MSSTGVAGFCPMGCGKTLYFSGRRVLCSAENCPRPSAVAEILAGSETEHIVLLDENGGWIMRHPLRERLDDKLMTCELVPIVAAACCDGDEAPGRYRVTSHGEMWERL